MAQSEETDQKTKNDMTFVSVLNDTELPPQPYVKKSLCTRFNDWVNRIVGVSRQKLLATQDVNIVTKKRMRIYSILNLVCFLIEIGVFVLL